MNVMMNPFKGSEESCEDKEKVLQIVRTHWNNLRYVSENLRNDREVVMEAIKQNGSALKYATKQIKGDKNFIIDCLKANGKRGGLFQFVSSTLRMDKQVCVLAVSLDGYDLEFVKGEMKDDRDVVLASVIEKGWSLKYAGKKLRADKEVIQAAIEEDEQAGQFALKMGESVDEYSFEKVSVISMIRQKNILKKSNKSTEVTEGDNKEYQWKNRGKFDSMSQRMPEEALKVQKKGKVRVDSQWKEKSSGWRDFLKKNKRSKSDN